MMQIPPKTRKVNKAAVLAKGEGVKAPLPSAFDAADDEGDVKFESDKVAAPLPLLQQWIIGFDTEYQLADNGKDNLVLCYSYCVWVGGETAKGVIYPDSSDVGSRRLKQGQRNPKRNRIRFSVFLTAVIKRVMSALGLKTWPIDIVLAAHFMKADLFHFDKAFDEFKTAIQSVHKTVASIAKAPYGIDLGQTLHKSLKRQEQTLRDGSGNGHKVRIRFFDTMLLVPAGRTLAHVGDLIELPKLEIASPYSIERMKEYLEGDKEGFEAYAIRDAEIACVYLVRMIQFVVDHFYDGDHDVVKGIPYTIGGMALKAFSQGLGRDQLDHLFNVTTKTVTKFDSKAGRVLSKKVREMDIVAGWFESNAIEAYSGGMNMSFTTGLLPSGVYYDFDLQACYPVCMMSLYRLDHDKAFPTEDTQDFLRGDMGVALVRFKFAAGTMYPSIPVRTEKNGLVYPLSGQAYCTAPEIEAACNMGCELEILQGFIVPWDTTGQRVFEPFMKWARDMRLKYESGSLSERLFKEIMNSLYGKMAQGLNGKRGFDVDLGFSKPLPPTIITNAFMASHTTGFARAVLAEVISRLPDDVNVISVTTDGLIVDAPLDRVDLTGPLCSRYRELFHILQPGGGEIMVEKHRAKSLVCIKTRGQLTVEACEGHPIITAKAGLKTPPDVDKNKYCLGVWFDRTPETKVDASHLTSTREMFLGEVDMIMEKKKQRLSYEPDMKRWLVNPRTITAHDGRSHVLLDSQPFETVDAMLTARTFFDAWRTENCMKTEADYDSWVDFYYLKMVAKAYGISLKNERSCGDLLITMFIRAVRRGAWLADGFGTSMKEMDAWFKEIGFTHISYSRIQNAGKPAFAHNLVPVVESSIKAFKCLQERYPELDYREIFQESMLEQVELALGVGHGE